jgi:hypothetical protein
MSSAILFISTSQIKSDAFETCKDAFRKSVEFLDTNGPQLFAKVCIDEKEYRAHTIQVHRDSESILTHWEIADPYMRDVMQYLTTTRVDIYGNPNEDVLKGMEQLASQGAEISVKPHFAGFSRLSGVEQ